MKKEKSFKKSSAGNTSPVHFVFQSVSIKNIPDQEALELLRKKGFDINEDEAREIMQFLYTVTQVTLKEFFSP